MNAQANTGVVVLLLIATALLLAIYVGAYVALVEPQVADRPRVTVFYDEPRVYFRGYHNGGEWAWRLFQPLELLDRWFRPHAWPSQTRPKARLGTHPRK